MDSEEGADRYSLNFDQPRAVPSAEATHGTLVSITDSEATIDMEARTIPLHGSDHDSMSSGSLDSEDMSPAHKEGFAKKSKRAIGRSLPIAADVVIFLLQLGLFGTFMYFAYIWPELG